VSAIGINIHTEDSFCRYATSLSADFARDVTYLDEMDRWDEVRLEGRDNPAFAELTFFLGTRAALELSGPKGIRSGPSALMHAAGELDPDKKLHHMVFGCVPLFRDEFAADCPLQRGVCCEPDPFDQGAELQLAGHRMPDSHSCTRLLAPL
jgi:hypothetical protein